ncbi:MAG: Hsp20/alpha crystallin family protein [Reichenbachiella sp.]|uniref:Hsp20/alpha crystallin family protein n=1 Tax=Reichenbachiella sp. TaxID=2184521 RepID=UPI0032669691
MTLSKIRNHTFQRIGDRYANYFDADHFMGRSSMDNFDISKPKRNLKKTERSYHIDVALPGFDKEEIKVTLAHNKLYVTAKRDELENYKDGFLRKEFHTDHQQRQFSLVPEIDQNAVSCDFSNGILHINLPLRQLKDQGIVNRKIEVL